MFLCLTCSKAKQTETLAFGAEKSLLQGLARKACDLCSKYLNSLMVFKGDCLFIYLRKIFQRQKLGLGLQGGWYSRDLVLSLKLSSCLQDGGLSSFRRTQRYILCIFLEGELGLCFVANLLFLNYISFVSAFLHLPKQKPFEYTLCNSERRFKRLQFLQTIDGEPGKAPTPNLGSAWFCLFNQTLKIFLFKNTEFLRFLP